MNRFGLFLLLTFGLLSCSEGEKKQGVEYFNLHDLCKSPDATPEQIQEFLDLNVDLIEKRDEWEKTPLHWAARNNSNPEVIRLLIKAGADVNAGIKSGKVTPLYFALERNENPDIISLLIKAGAKVNASDRRGRTPLHMAAAESTPEVISVLLRSGANLSARNEEGWTPLHYSAAYNSDPEATSALLEAGADIHSKDRVNRTPLHQAAGWTGSWRLGWTEGGNPPAIRVLLQSGADPNAVSERGHVLAVACKGSSLRHFVYGGVDVNTVLNQGNSLLHVACATNVSRSTLNILINAGANLDAKNEFGETPLHVAVRPCCRWFYGVVSKNNYYGSRLNCHWSCAAALISAGADVNAVTRDGLTPLHLLVQKKGATYVTYTSKTNEILSQLIEAGADPNARASDGSTPLHHAALNVGLQGLLGKALIEYGADPYIQNLDGYIPADLLMEYMSNLDGIELFYARRLLEELVD